MTRLETNLPPAPNPPRHKKRKSGVVVPHQPTWVHRVLAWVVVFSVRCVSATLRYRWDDRSGFIGDAAEGPAIFCVWHNRIVLTMRGYFSYARPSSHTSGLAAMVSASKDGGFLAAILERFGVQPVRGSSSRRGPQALLELTSWAQRGYDLAITPDGPRGPCYVVQEGIMALAQITGLPIVPCNGNLAWKIRVNSWDRFQIPLPFSRCDMISEKAVRVPRDATIEEREVLRQQLEQTMRRMTKD